MYQNYFAAYIRKIQRLLERRISTSDHRHIFIFVKFSVTDGTERYSFSCKSVLSFYAQLFRLSSCGYYNAFAFEGAAESSFDRKNIFFFFKRQNLIKFQLNGILHDLLQKSVGKFHSGYRSCRRKIFDFRRECYLPAVTVFFYDYN